MSAGLSGYGYCTVTFTRTNGYDKTYINCCDTAGSLVLPRSLQQLLVGDADADVCDAEPTSVSMTSISLIHY